MSGDASADVVRRVWEALGEGRMPSDDDVAPDAVVAGSIFPEIATPGERLGSRFRTLAQPGLEERVRLTRLDIAEDGRVVAVGIATRRVPDGGSAELVACVYTFRDGRIARAEVFHEPRDAYTLLHLDVPDTFVAGGTA